MRLMAALISICVLAPLARAQATQQADDTSIELRARQAFTRGEYAAALPLLQKLSADYKSQPDKLGPIQEQINVCIKAIAAASAQQPQAIAPEMSPETRKPHPAPKSGENINLTIKELGNFEYD